MTSIIQIGRRVCMKRENNPRQSIEGKMLTIPQTMWKTINNPAQITITPHNTTNPQITMSKVTTIQTIPPVNVKIWETRRKYFWAYNYPQCNKNGPFKSEKLALLDATQFSSDS